MQTEDAREPNECTIPICVSMQFGISAIAYDDCHHHVYWFELTLLHPSQCWRKSHVISTFNAGFSIFLKWPETCCFALHCWNQTVDVRSHHLKEFAGVSDAFWHSIAMTKPKCILLSYEIYINSPLLRFHFSISLNNYKGFLSTTSHPDLQGGERARISGWGHLGATVSMGNLGDSSLEFDRNWENHKDPFVRDGTLSAFFWDQCL